MAYMVRLGIWGPGSPFRDFNDFLAAVEKRGVGAMEIVAMDMKLRGMYIARQLSFQVGEICSLHLSSTQPALLGSFFSFLITSVSDVSPSSFPNWFPHQCVPFILFLSILGHLFFLSLIFAPFLIFYLPQMIPTFLFSFLPCLTLSSISLCSSFPFIYRHLLFFSTFTHMMKRAGV